MQHPVISIATFFFLLAISNVVIAQEVPIEERVPADIADRPVVANLVERLRILRVNESKLGEKHPSRKNIRSQIDSLEKQLAERIAIEAPPPVRSPFKPSERKEVEKPRIKPTETGVETNPSASPTEAPTPMPALQRLSRGVWGEKVVIPRIQSEFDLRLQATYSQLKVHCLSSVGVFPALGLLWGIESDHQLNGGRIWQWQDQNSTSSRSSFIESDEHILDVVFANDFEKTGIVYFLQSESVSIDSDGGNESRRRHLKLYRRILDRFPPFAVLDRVGELMAEAVSDYDQDARLFLYGRATVGLFLGPDTKLTRTIDGVRSVEWGKGCWVLGMDASSPGPGPLANELTMLGTSHRSSLIWYDKDRIVFGVEEGSEWGVYEVLLGRKEAPTRLLGMPVSEPIRGAIVKGSVGSLPQGGLLFGDAATGSIWLVPLFGQKRGQAIELCKTSRELHSIGLDSAGESIVVTGDGVYQLNRLDSKETSLGSATPRFLSDTRWFEDTKKLLPSSGFLEYKINEKDFLDGFTSRQVIGFPGDEFVDIGSPVRWRFPDRTIAIRTLVKSHEWSEEGEPIPIETRVLVKRDGEWFGLRYVWDATGGDAELVSPNHGADSAPNVNKSRNKLRCGTAGTENCNSCHNNSQNDYLLGFNSDTLYQPLSGFAQGDQIGAMYDAKVLGRHAHRLEAMMNTVRESKPGILVGEVEPASIDGSRDDSMAPLVSAWFGKSLIEDNLPHWLNAVPSENGFLKPKLAADWSAKDEQFATIVSQSRLIYTLGIGYIATSDKRYLVEMERGCEFLLQYFVDQKHGGFIWSVEPDGVPRDRIKDSYGHAFGIFGLSHAFTITKNEKYKKAALAAWLSTRTKMMDPYGGLYFKAAEDYSNPSGASQNPVMHYFEALLALYEATRIPEVLVDADSIADFVTSRLWRSPGYIPEGFDSGWRVPVENDSGVYIVIGHQVEWAFLLSRGVELGLSPRYLRFGHKLMDYAMSHGYDEVMGGLGEPPSRQAKGSWQQAEFLRALMRYADRHGRTEFWEPAEKTRQLIESDFMDPKLGGWPDRKTGDKGSEWHCGYHEVGMYLEGMRVAKRRGNHE